MSYSLSRNVARTRKDKKTAFQKEKAMEAYGIIMTVFVFLSLFLNFLVIWKMKKEKGSLLSSNDLEKGAYRVIAKSPCGDYAIVENIYNRTIGVNIYSSVDILPDVGKTFQWKITKLRGYEREAIPVEEGGIFPPA